MPREPNNSAPANAKHDWPAENHMINSWRSGARNHRRPRFWNGMAPGLTPKRRVPSSDREGKMGDASTPRQMVKALLQGATPSRPLLVPVIFSLGARLQNLPLPHFLANPTKIV